MRLQAVPEYGFLRETTLYSTSETTSADGTRIGFRHYGAGPALILVQGAIGTVESYHDLASHLAADFSVYVPERPGRPLSPREYTPDHSVAERSRICRLSFRSPVLTASSGLVQAR